MGQTNHDTGHDAGDNNKKQQASGHIGEKQKDTEGRPDKGGTAGQSGGEQAKNRSSNPGSVRE